MKLRIKITKEHDARFISHLEYARTINRALRRAKLPVAYSEGFNPHIKMSLASALGVGIASLSEYAEIELSEQVEPTYAMQVLNENLPEGIRVIDCDIIDKKADRKLMAMLASASYEIHVPYINKDEFIQAIEEYNNAEQLLFVKKSAPKKPEKKVDIKEYVSCISYDALQDGVKIAFDCKITPTGTLKAQDVLAALKLQYELSFDVLSCDMIRTALYKEDKQPLLNSYK